MSIDYLNFKMKVLALVLFWSGLCLGGWVFTPPERVDDDTTESQQNYPRIAVDGQGNVYCVFEDWRNGHPEVYFAYKPKGGEWSKNEKVLKEIPNANPGAEIAVSEEGKVYCVFCARYGTVERDVYFTERSREEEWSDPIKINDDSGDNSQRSPSLTINRETLYCCWLDSRNTGPFSHDIYFSMKPKDGDWTPNEKVNDMEVPLALPLLWTLLETAMWSGKTQGITRNIETISILLLDQKAGNGLRM